MQQQQPHSLNRDNLQSSLSSRSSLQLFELEENISEAKAKNEEETLKQYADRNVSVQSQLLDLIVCPQNQRIMQQSCFIYLLIVIGIGYFFMITLVSHCKALKRCHGRSIEKQILKKKHFWQFYLIVNVCANYLPQRIPFYLIDVSSIDVQREYFTTVHLSE